MKKYLKSMKKRQCFSDYFKYNIIIVCPLYIDLEIYWFAKIFVGFYLAKHK